MKGRAIQSPVINSGNLGVISLIVRITLTNYSRKVIKILALADERRF
jgi:hypothetical protein